MRSTACTERTRWRNASSTRWTCSGPSGAWLRSHAGLSLRSASSKAGSRGAVTVAKRWASRGAGVAGACGANVQMLSMNGTPSAAERPANWTPSRASTFVR